MLWAVGAMAVSGIASGISTYQSVKNQASQLQQEAVLKFKQASNLYEDAANLATANSVNEDIMRRQADLELSKFRAQTKTSGLTGGTLIDLDFQTAENMEADILMERYNGHVQYVMKKKEAYYAKETAEYMMRSAKKMKKSALTQSLLSGLGAGASAFAMAGGFDQARSGGSGQTSAGKTSAGKAKGG